MVGPMQTWDLEIYYMGCSLTLFLDSLVCQSCQGLSGWGRGPVVFLCCNLTFIVRAAGFSTPQTLPDCSVKVSSSEALPQTLVKERGDSFLLHNSNFVFSDQHLSISPCPCSWQLPFYSVSMNETFSDAAYK